MTVSKLIASFAINIRLYTIHDLVPENVQKYIPHHYSARGGPTYDRK